MRLRVRLAVCALLLGASPALAQPETTVPAPSPVQRFSIDGQITMLHYPDPSKADAFWHGVLGFRKAYASAWVNIYEIAPQAYVGVLLKSRGVHKDTNGKAVTVIIMTHDLSTWYDLVEKAGAPIVRPLKVAGDPQGLTSSFMVADPEGYMVEFVTFNDAHFAASPR